MRARALALSLAALALSGCGLMSWFSDSTRKPTELTAIKSTLTPKQAWRVSVGAAKGYQLHPDTEQGKVYSAAPDGMVTVIDEESGRVTARFDSKKKISGGVRVEEGLIVIGTIKGDVTAFDASGRQLWNTNVAGEVIAPTAVSKKVVVVRTSDGRIFGLSTVDGKRLWVYQRPSPALLLRTDAGVIAVGGDVVAGFPGGKLIALDIDDGKLTWEVNVSLPRGATELERIADVAGIPAMESGRVCAASFQGKVACFEIQTRNMVWSRDISSARALALDGKNAYVVDDTGAVHALDKGSGASVWKQDKLAYRRLTAPVIVNGNVIVGDGFGFLHVLAPQDGAFIGRMATDGSAIQSLVPSTKGLVVQTAGGSVLLVNF